MAHSDTELGGSGLGALSSARARRVVLALVFDLTLVTGEVIGGAFAHSTGLLADAGHNLADGAALLLTYVALRYTRRAPTEAHSFGYHRATILTAIGNVGLLLVATVLIVTEAIGRLVHPVVVRSGTTIVVAGLALLANLAAVAVLRDRTRDLGMRAAVLHLGADALGAAGVGVAGVIELVTGGHYRLDAVVALAIAALITVQGFHIVRTAIAILLESTPNDLDLAALRTAIESTPGIVEVHDLHCWSLSSELRALSAHLVLAGNPSLDGARALADGVKELLATRFEIAHATLELESDSALVAHEVRCVIETPSPRPRARLARRARVEN